MSDPLPQPESAGVRAGLPPEPTPAASEEIAYQPISGWAIAGVLTGGVFAVLVAVSTAVALWQGAPLFFPVWIVGVAVVGVVVSYMGQRHVQSSEGTRAGAKLARIGLWLSLVSGLSYLSYYVVTGLALQNQANAFVMEKTDDDSGFFPRLRDGATDPIQLNHAFLLTRPGRERDGFKPDNDISMRTRFDVAREKGSPGDLAIFKYGMAPQTFFSALPRVFFKDGAKDVKVTELGAQDWTYEKKSYQVSRNYRIETKELEWTVTLMIHSTEAESAGQGRKWYVNLLASGITQAKLTPFGNGMHALRAHSHQALDKEIADLNAGKSFDLKIYDQTKWDNRFGDDFAAKRDLIYQLFADASPKRIEQFRVWAKGDETGKWEEVGGKIRIHHAFRFALRKSPKDHPAYFVDGYSVQETVKAIDPVHVNPILPTEWNLVQIVFTNITSIPDQKDPMHP